MWPRFVIHSVHEKSVVLVFWQEERLVGAIPFTWNFGSDWPCCSENDDFQSIFARSASAVTHSTKCSINTNRKSTTRFPMSLYRIRCPKGAQKRKTAVFRVKLHFTLCEYCQRQKMVHGERPLLRDNVTETDHLPPLKTSISIQYSLVAPQP